MSLPRQYWNPVAEINPGQFLSSPLFKVTALDIQEFKSALWRLLSDTSDVSWRSHPDDVEYFLLRAADVLADIESDIERETTDSFRRRYQRQPDPQESNV